MNEQEKKLKSEARYWIRMRREKGLAWWNARRDGIERKRGEQGLRELLEAMAEEENAK